MTKNEFEHALKARGFRLTPMGGGCVAWTNSPAEGQPQIVVTDEGGAGIPGDDDMVLVGEVLNNEGLGCELCESFAQSLDYIDSRL